MLNLSELKYQTILLTETGQQIDISNALTGLTWEENKKELASRITCDFFNTRQEGQEISDITKPGCIICILASCGSMKQEVARGIITDWTTHHANTASAVSLTCYDELYNLQKSQDNIYYSAGMGTQAVIMDILQKWEIPLAEYKGPNVTHAKLVYKTKYLSDILLEILDDAVKKGAGKSIIRAVSGKISILPLGSNTPVYHLGEENTSAVKAKYSTSNMITRVKVLAKEDDDGKSKVEAVLYGKTQYGIRQKIYVRSSDDSMDAAQSAAQEILNEEGDIEKTLTIEGPDVPFIHKGDLVHIVVGALNGYFYVNSIQHNAANSKMSMDLEAK